MSTWLLSCNPKKFDLEGHRRDGRVLSSWTVVRYVSEVAAGDEFALWVGGPDAGVVAYGRFTGPAEYGQPDLRYWAEDRGPRHFVPLVVDKWLDLRVPKGRLASDPRMTGATILRQPFAGSPHRVTEEEWHAVRQAIEVSEGKDPQWDLDPGDEIRRVYLHAKHGGALRTASLRAAPQTTS
ncbi:EVE domain-containing protein [Streptomyces brevispora]|uniref:EVE domain-containing protein n=1 Tax=Streptomyces brevispora TaxID=887462 RepID=UPI002E3529A9|nr:EVE domain-containing protein [Streptomyces brevispora]